MCLVDLSLGCQLLSEEADFISESLKYGIILDIHEKLDNYLWEKKGKMEKKRSKGGAMKKGRKTQSKKFSRQSLELLG